MIDRIAGRLQRWRWTNLWRTSPLAVGRRRRYIRTLAPHRLLGRARSRSRDTAIAAAYPVGAKPTSSLTIAKLPWLSLILYHSVSRRTTPLKRGAFQ
jgi:hypothetical protein